MTGGTNYIVAAYLFAAIILGGYVVGLVRRLQKERELAGKRNTRGSPQA